MLILFATGSWISTGIVGSLYEISYCLQVKRALEEGQMAWRNVKSFLITQRQGTISLFWILSYTEHTVSEPLFFLHCRKEPGATPKDRNSSSQYTSKGYNSNHLIISLTKLSNYTVRHSDVLVIYIYISALRFIVEYSVLYTRRLRVRSVERSLPLGLSTSTLVT